MKVLLKLSELHVLLDAAAGSLHIADRWNIWRFGTKERQAVINTVLARMGKVALSVEDDVSPIEQPEEVKV